MVKSLRESLSGHGIEGMTGSDGESSQGDFRWALARWSIRSGWVTLADVEDANARRAEPTIGE
ncbi:hypothetical protein GCM10022251_77480 [Phytohabitans flavus]|uniref:Uncharacterized protein n=1 Tax=Phytohabitans flavus TaxID=1076124 RepID=A0A6F8XIM3_9ACTN|nr:hypothetical protein [Phytohabitans flavus]BCB73660.1 hypothetical protein Pflav_000700 [Phytohabitans flavus]